MAAITCSCGQVIIEQPGIMSAIMPNACPDCDPEGYPLRWSCPLPPRDPGNNLAYLRRRVQVLEERMTFINAVFERETPHPASELHDVAGVAYQSVEEGRRRGSLDP